MSGTTIGQWARRGLIRSSVSDADPRVYSVEDVAEAALVRALLDRGMRHADVHRLVDAPQRLRPWPLSQATLATTTRRRARGSSCATTRATGSSPRAAGSARRRPVAAREVRLRLAQREHGDRPGRDLGRGPRRRRARRARRPRRAPRSPRPGRAATLRRGSRPATHDSSSGRSAAMTAAWAICASVLPELIASERVEQVGQHVRPAASAHLGGRRRAPSTVACSGVERTPRRLLMRRQAARALSTAGEAAATPGCGHARRSRHWPSALPATPLEDDRVPGSRVGLLGRRRSPEPSTPALLWREVDARPKASTAWRTIAAQSAATVTSPATKSAWPPSCSIRRTVSTPSSRREGGR